MKTYKYGSPNKYGDYPYLYSNKYTLDELPNILRERLPESYDMALVDQDEIDLLAELVNQGIDSHLEACTLSNKPHLVDGRKYGIGFDIAGMICLIRRMSEHRSDTAYDLLSCIFETLQIEYTGF